MNFNPFGHLPGAAIGAVALIFAGNAAADDWPMFGRDHTRNPVSPEKNPPVSWNVYTGSNIKWRAAIGFSQYSAPVSAPIVANGLVWIGTNNGQPRDPKFTGAAGALMCFRESDGKFLYQRLSPQQEGPTYPWAYSGINSSPLVEGNRLWFTTTLAEIICLDIGPLQQGSGAPREIWKLDMIKDLGICPARGVMGGGPLCSIGSSHGDLIYVITANGMGFTADFKAEMRAPEAPDLVCLDKTTGKVVWRDSSPGKDVIRGEYGNPIVIEVNGRAQVVAPQGDGWLRSFDALTGELIWKFDINPKSVSRHVDPSNSADYFMTGPVCYEGKLYIGSGQYVELGNGTGRLCCIDPGRRGDISPEIDDGPDQGKPNPNSGEVWHFDKLGRTMSTVAVRDGIVIAAGHSGLAYGNVYCLDARTGKLHWQHDLNSHVQTSPLIVDDRVYVADDEGVVHVFGMSREKRAFAEIEMDDAISSSPVFANGVLYLAGSSLTAIQEGHNTPPPPKEGTGAKP